MSHHGLTRALALLVLAACGESSGPNEDGEGATLSGTVRSAVTSAALPDARVSIGTRQATSDQNGRFSLTDVPVGAATVRAERAGYQAEEAAVTVSAGANTRDFALSPREIYEAAGTATFVPAAAATLRGAIIILGGPVASGFVTGERLTPATSSPELESSLQNLGAGLRELAATSSVAILGSSTTGMANSSTSDDQLFAALSSAAEASGHPELANAPVLVFGLSAGAREASGLASRNPGRAIGLLVRVPSDVSTLTGAALDVPTFVMQAALDEVVSNFSVRTKFASNRALGGLWSLAVEPGVGHSMASARGNSAALNWIRWTLDLRLPATAGDPLVTLDEASGWLGNQGTLEIAPWAEYPEGRQTASWLLSELAAASWKALGTAEGGE